jgi:glycosyltransferase involved in cell wall biosynthesis
MKLEILIPHYKETIEELSLLLDSIALQQQINFADIGVIIANDGPEAKLIPSQWIKNNSTSKGIQAKENNKIYPFQILNIISNKKKGVSATRNAALDAATADYVMFCDADDMFCDACGLSIVMREIDNGGFDTLVSCFREETRTSDGQPVYINRENDSTFVHGKVHNRNFLIKNKIRWNKDLTIHEDSYFNILTRELADPQRAKYCPMPFYLWKWRDSSVCRHDPDYILKTYSNMLDSNDALVDSFVKRMLEEKANFYVGFMVIDAYYTMNKPEWLDKTNEKYRKVVSKRFSRYWKKHKKQFNKLTDQEKATISVGVRQRSVCEGMLMEAITLDQWLDRIEQI